MEPVHNYIMLVKQQFTFSFDFRFPLTVHSRHYGSLCGVIDSADVTNYEDDRTRTASEANRKNRNNHGNPMPGFTDDSEIHNVTYLHREYLRPGAES